MVEMQISETTEVREKKQYNLGHSTYYINRELGMLAFQERVFK